MNVPAIITNNHYLNDVNQAIESSLNQLNEKHN